MKHTQTHQEKSGPIYTAVCTMYGKFLVKTIGPCGDFHVCGDIKEFNTFEEADQVAQRIANGMYGYQCGTYISMR